MLIAALSSGLTPTPCATLPLPLAPPSPPPLPPRSAPLFVFYVPPLLFLLPFFLLILSFPLCSLGANTGPAKSDVSLPTSLYQTLLCFVYDRPHSIDPRSPPCSPDTITVVLLSTFVRKTKTRPVVDYCADG